MATGHGVHCRCTRWVLWILCIVSAPIRAHSMHQSAVLLDFRDKTVDAELQLPVDRLSISFRQPVDASHLASERAALVAYVLAHVHPLADGTRPFKVTCRDLDIETIEGAPYLVVHLILAPPGRSTPDLFELNYDVITHEIVTHVVLVSIRSDVKARIPPEEPLLIGVIRGDRKSVTVDRMKLL
jgi:hypothetical protein